MNTTAGTGQGRNQEPGAPSGLPHERRGAQALDPSPADFQEGFAGSWTRHKVAGTPPSTDVG